MLALLTGLFCAGAVSLFSSLANTKIFPMNELYHDSDPPNYLSS